MEDASIAIVPGQKIVRFSEHVSECPSLVIANNPRQDQQGEYTQQGNEEETSFSTFNERLV